MTDGLLRTLDRREVVGVLAHEVGHLKAGDTSVMALSDAISRLVQGISYVGMFTLLLAIPLAIAGYPLAFPVALIMVAAPYLTTLVQLALSRSREYDADLAAARLTGDPEALALALQDLDRATGTSWERIFVSRRRVPDPLILQTHPATEERVRRLRELEPEGSERALHDDSSLLPVHHQVPGPVRLRFPAVRW